jgi:hypothetical protein
MEILNKDLLFYLGLRLKGKDLANFCCASRRFAVVLWRNDEFWRIRYRKVFNVVSSSRVRSWKILFKETSQNLNFVKFVYDQFINSYLDSKGVMNLYNKVFNHFYGKKGYDSQALVAYLVSVRKGLNSENTRIVFYVFSYIMRQGEERITKENFIELCK